MIKPLLAMLFMYVVHDVVSESVIAEERERVSPSTVRDETCASLNASRLDFWIGAKDIEQNRELSTTKTVTAVNIYGWRQDVEGLLRRTRP